MTRLLTFWWLAFLTIASGHRGNGLWDDTTALLAMGGALVCQFIALVRLVKGRL